MKSSGIINGPRLLSVLPSDTCVAGRLAASLLGALACLVMPACKQAADASKTVEPPPKAAQESRAPARGGDTLVQQATSSYRQRIQEAAREHAASAKRMQEANVLVMKEVTQREQLEPKREVVRKFLTSNEALKTLLVNEEGVFKEELAKLNVPQARIESELEAFQSGIRGKAAVIRMREEDQRIGNSLLGALDFLDEIWGQWNYNKDFDQVQFSPPGALKKYNDFLEAIEMASREQKELQEQ
jgi:hypothetical protein